MKALLDNYNYRISDIGKMCKVEAYAVKAMAIIQAIVSAILIIEYIAFAVRPLDHHMLLAVFDKTGYMNALGNVSYTFLNVLVCSSSMFTSVAMALNLMTNNIEHRVNVSVCFLTIEPIFGVQVLLHCIFTIRSSIEAFEGSELAQLGAGINLLLCIPFMVALLVTCCSFWPTFIWYWNNESKWNPYLIGEEPETEMLMMGNQRNQQNQQYYY